MAPAVKKTKTHATLADCEKHHFSRKAPIRGRELKSSSREMLSSWSSPKFLLLHKTVIPRSLLAAAPCGVVAMMIAFVTRMLNAQDAMEILRDVAAWTAFSMLVTFLVVFRTSQSYGRFWEGCTACHRMRAEWFDACSALMSFCRRSKAEEPEISDFKHTLIRLFSMLHGVALAEIEDRSDTKGMTFSDIEAYTFELLDPTAFDKHSIHLLLRAKHKPELLYQWIQCLIIDSFHSGVLTAPPPIITRAYQELSSGMVAFHEAQKISTIPLPLPYVQACDWMLILHWIFTPLVVPQFVYNPGWAFAFTFIQVFILWGLNFTAKEIENPFGRDTNDMDRRQMQREMNSVLKALVDEEMNKLPRILRTNSDVLGESTTLISIKNVVEHLAATDTKTSSNLLMLAEQAGMTQLSDAADSDTSCNYFHAKSEQTGVASVPEDSAVLDSPHKELSTKHEKKENGVEHHVTVDPTPVSVEVLVDGFPVPNMASQTRRCGSGHSLVQRQPAPGGRCSGCGSQFCPSIPAWRCEQCSLWGCGLCTSGTRRPGDRLTDVTGQQPHAMVLERDPAPSLETQRLRAARPRHDSRAVSIASGASSTMRKVDL